MSDNLRTLIDQTYRRITPVYLRHAANLHPSPEHAELLHEVAVRCEQNRVWPVETARLVAANASRALLPAAPRSGRCAPEHRTAHAAARAAYSTTAWMEQAVDALGMIPWGTPPLRVVQDVEHAVRATCFGDGPDLLAAQAVMHLQPALGATFAEVLATARL